MTADEVLEKLEPLRRQVTRPAWLPQTEPGEGDPAASRFGGRPLLAVGEDWPRCGKCGGPLTLFVQLDLDALPADTPDYGGGLLQVFYCTSDACLIDSWSAFSDSHLLRVRRHRDGRPGDPPSPECLFEAKQVVGWRRIEDRPQWDDFAAETKIELDFESGRTDGNSTILRHPGLGLDAGALPDDLPEKITEATPGDKLAGWPYWIQGPEWPDCPTCGTRMRLLLQIDSGDHLPFMFGDAGTGHVTQCPHYRDTLAFAWACC